MLQWEKADIMFCQSYLNNELNKILLPVDALLCNSVICHKHSTDLECYYNNIVSSLTVTAEHCIPSFIVGVHKHWWTPDLGELKQNCTGITNLWNSIGRPRSCSINSERFEVQMSL